MESRYRSVEESKSWRSEEESEDGSSELMEQNEEIREGSGIRWYECVFCKRGFTTAQALGGHMNIHRKHRASVSVSASTNHHHNSINNPNHNISASAFYSPISTLDPPPPNNYYSSPHHHDQDQVQLYHNYHQFSFPANAPLPPAPITSNNQRGLSLNSNLRQNNIAHHHTSEDDGLDLELRLGYHP